MSVWCNACGRLSQDHEFCDHCNADLGTSGENLPPDRCPLIPDGIPISMEQRQILAFPDASITLQTEGHSWRVHWIAQADWKARATVVEKRLALQIEALPTGRLIDDPLGRWLVFEEVVDAPAAAWH